MRTPVLALVLVCAIWSSADAFPYSKSINNTVTGTIIHHTWDPADPLTISGTLLDNINGHCQDAPVVSNVSEVEVDLYPAPPPFTTYDRHVSCTGETELFFSPGTDASGHYSIPLGRGGGCSWVTGNGVENLAAWIKLTFWQGTAKWQVACGDGAVYQVLPGCSEAPTVYGVLASPDLTANGFVDSSDMSLFAGSFFGKPITLVSGWQADFNHVGRPNVDTADLAYIAWRLGKNCGSQKVETVAYDADIHNLELDYVVAVLDRAGITKAQILAIWDEMGLSYDRSAAAAILSEPATERPSWTEVKQLYR